MKASNAPRFTCLLPGSSGQSCLPPPCASLNNAGCLFGPPPSGGFPICPSNTAFAINWGLDQSVKTPYTHMFNFSLARQITARSSLQIAYVGSVGRRLPMQVDMGMPTNLNDPVEQHQVFPGCNRALEGGRHGCGRQLSPAHPIFREYLSRLGRRQHPELAFPGLRPCAPGSLPAKPTATQNIYQIWACSPHNETLTLKFLDLPNLINQFSAALPNSKFGPYAFYHDQFSSLYAWRNIGTSDYNALQVTYNARWGTNLQGQFNYTFSKSFDEASAAERIGPYEGTGGTGNDLNGGGIVINSWDPLALRSLSDFNAYHQLNANLVYQLPFGKGQSSSEIPIQHSMLWSAAGTSPAFSAGPAVSRLPLITASPGPPTGTSRATPCRTARLHGHRTPRT